MTPSVLIVENNREVLRLVANMVAAQGWRPVPVSTLAEARRSLESERVDAVISDVELDDGDGLTLIREIRSASRTGVPAVMMSSYASPEVRHLAQRAGAIDLLSKPFRMEQLSSLLLREFSEHPAS